MYSIVMSTPNCWRDICIPGGRLSPPPLPPGEDSSLRLDSSLDDRRLSLSELSDLCADLKNSSKLLGKKCCSWKLGFVSFSFPLESTGVLRLSGFDSDSFPSSAGGLLEGKFFVGVAYVRVRTGLEIGHAGRTILPVTRRDFLKGRVRLINMVLTDTCDASDEEVGRLSLVREQKPRSCG